MTGQRAETTVHHAAASDPTPTAAIGIAVGALGVSTSGVLIALAGCAVILAVAYAASTVRRGSSGR
ncbi:hypothetical protein DFR70_108169 [Nocardia tenerifensis]|uniref:Uncharacterized protein n=1 Tax=Nocardia tenerifensis TaxID=228006 RepID=A0A318K0V4_9NOCA|nr:hypothetical protein [Nocardia tenerifensis]PXX61611.1 hypothetical protein DFR70_108169 [Nocardia tenerifensis]